MGNGMCHSIMQGKLVREFGADDEEKLIEYFSGLTAEELDAISVGGDVESLSPWRQAARSTMTSLRSIKNV